MTDKGASEHSEGTTNSGVAKASRKPSKAILGVAISAALVAGGMFAAYKTGMFSGDDSHKYASSDELRSLENRIRAQVDNLKQNIPALITREIEKVSKEEGFGTLNELQKQEIAADVVRTMDLDGKLQSAISAQKSEIVRTTSSAVLKSLNKDLPSKLREEIDIALQPYHAFNTSQVRTNQSVDDRFIAMEADLSELHTKLRKGKNAIAIPEQKRTRLRGFNILDEIAEGVFSVRAPDRKNGRSHYVTLWDSEPFVSVLGSHEVTGVEGTGKDAVLLIGSKFYIDKERVDYTPQELANIRKKRQKKSTKVTKKPNQTVIAKRSHSATIQANTSVDHIGKLPKPVVPTQTAGVPIVAQSSPKSVVNAPVSSGSSAQYLNGRILLPNWAMIVKSPELDSAVVVNLTQTEGERMRSLEKGKYYDFIGTVNEITADGTVCSDTYCIGALQ